MMALTVSLTGERAVVKADNFSFTPSLSGSRVVMGTPSKTVTASFSDPQAHVKWSGGLDTVCSSFLDNLGRLIDPIVLPYATPFTLGDAETLIEYFRSDLGEVTDHFRDVGIYGAYLFTMNTKGIVRRVLIDGVDTAVDQSLFADPDEENVSNARFAVISEELVYVFYSFDNGLTEEVRIVKLDFGGGGRTLVEYFPAVDTVAGDTVAFWSSGWLMRAKWGSKDYLVGTSWWIGDISSLPRIYVYDLIEETNIDFRFESILWSSGQYVEFDDYYFVTRPSMYDGKVVFTYYANYYDTEAFYVPWPTFIVDLADDSINKVTAAIEGGMAVPNVQGSGVDQDTGMYYVWVSNQNEGATPHVILKIDLTDATPAYATSSALSYEGKIAQGETAAYALRYLDGPSRFRLMGPLPALTVRADTTNFEPMFIDETNDVAWQLDTDGNGLTGYNLEGLSDASMTLDWDGSIYKYASNRAIHSTLMFDGLFVAIVYSSQASPAAYQRELVLFGV
jgi:hypothetical protein